MSVQLYCAVNGVNGIRGSLLRLMSAKKREKAVDGWRRKGRKEVGRQKAAAQKDVRPRSNEATLLADSERRCDCE